MLTDTTLSLLGSGTRVNNLLYNPGLFSAFIFLSFELFYFRDKNKNKNKKKENDKWRCGQKDLSHVRALYSQPQSTASAEKDIISPHLTLFLHILISFSFF